MTERPGELDFGYVHTDIPEDMTIREWRRDRAARPRRHAASHATVAPVPLISDPDAPMDRDSSPSVPHRV